MIPSSSENSTAPLPSFAHHITFPKALLFPKLVKLDDLFIDIRHPYCPFLTSSSEKLPPQDHFHTNYLLASFAPSSLAVTTSELMAALTF